MTNQLTPHENFMQQALELAAQGRYSCAPNPMVGCVIVRADQVVGRGWHQRAGEAHAEVHAIAAAGAATTGATAYVTLEPCSHTGRTGPCADALIAAGVGHVVVAMQDPNPLVSGRGIARLRAAGITVDVGVLEAEARELNREFIARMERQRPWLRVKMAASLDGRTALANGESKWITSAAARADVHEFRARSGAILSTARTVLRDQAQLTARPNFDCQQPLRVIIDSQGLLTGSEPVFAATTPIVLVHTKNTPLKTWPSHVETLVVECTESGQVQLPALLLALADKQINSVWTECGAELAGALIEAELVDELLIYLAPKLMGSSAHGLLQLPTWQQMSQVPELSFKDVRQVGSDIRITAIPHRMRGDTTS